MSEPPLIVVSRDIVQRASARVVNADTGQPMADVDIGDEEELYDDVPAGSLMLDMQTANLLVVVYEALDKKENFQKMVDKIGVNGTVTRCWNVLNKHGVAQ
tara:strand:+ start:1927 stop:2229 length:303 start_codon:yes stop_codon:yes gene_type:complete